LKKHLETFFKSFSFPRDELSAVPPDQYAERFVKFIRANVRTKEETGQQPKEELSHVAIPEESPIATPSTEKPTPVRSQVVDDVDVIRTVVSPPDRPDQKVPAIKVQHPSPELRDRHFEKQMHNGIKSTVNGWSEDYFGEKVNGETTPKVVEA
jgi:hypothetical protein